MKWRIAVSVLMALPDMWTVWAAQTPPREQATIEQTGSTNTAPVKMTITPSGEAKVYPQNAAMRRTSVDAALSQRFFDDLAGAGPLSALPKVHCMKSASFGTSLFVTYNGEISPDLSCPGAADSKLRTLQKDVRELMQAAHATPHVRRGFS